MEVHRSFKGLSARFKAGCAVENLDSTSPMEVTGNLEISVDADTVEIVPRPKNSNQASMRACQEKTIVPTKNTYYALSLIRLLNANEAIEAKMVYTFTLHFTCPPDLQGSIFRAWMDCLSQKTDINVSWDAKGENSQDTIFNLRISSVDRTKILEVKQHLVTICSGNVATDAKEREIWDEFFATPEGKVRLQQLGRANGVILLSDISQCRIRVYGQYDDNTKLSLARALDREIGPEKSKQPINTLCPICGNFAKKEIQFSCGHVNCRDCFDRKINLAIKNLTLDLFPIKCEMECRQACVSIDDLRKYTDQTTLTSLFQSARKKIIALESSLIRNCRSPDCESVYDRGHSEEIFTCPGCLTQTCKLCDDDPHVDMSCTEASASKRQEEDLPLQSYKEESTTKSCPRCSILVERIDGCDRVVCQMCMTQLCWLCAEGFETHRDWRDHYALAHGPPGAQ